MLNSLPAKLLGKLETKHDIEGSIYPSILRVLGEIQTLLRKAILGLILWKMFI